MSEIRYIISDLDGTLVDTFEANFQAYRTVFARHGLDLTEAAYRRAFGLKIDDLCRELGFALDEETVKKIKTEKAECYPSFFRYLKCNTALLEFYRAFARQGGHLALATTASRKNVQNVLEHIGAVGVFEFLITGEEVKHGKPDPECFLLARDRWQAPTESILIFEDSDVGIMAAERAGFAVVRIGSAFYGN